MLDMEYDEKKKKKHSYLQFFPWWWPELTPTSHACFNIHLNLVDSSTRAAISS